MKLTKSYIDKLTYSKKNRVQDIHFDEGLAGFGIRVYPSGKKVFSLVYRLKGRRHIKVLGKYGVITLEQARERARRALVAILDNEDPLATQRSDQSGITFSALSVTYMDRYARQRKKSWLEDQRRIEKYLLPAFGNLQVNAIARADVARFHGDLGAQFPYAANRCLEQLSKMFELAKVWGFIPEEYRNPARGIEAYKEVKRDRWVKPTEFPRLVDAINKEENVYGRAAIWLYLGMGLRKNELLTAKWCDVDWDRKELRLADTKAGRPHYIPLSKPVLDILESLPREDGSPYILVGDRGGALGNMQDIWERVRKEAGLEDVRLHDLRRTLGSWLAQSGESLQIIGKVLNHSSLSSTQVYARLAEENVRHALEKHGEQLMTFVGGQESVTCDNASS